MALEIFKLVGSIFVDADEANKSLAKTDEKAESLGSTLAKGVGTAAKWGAAVVAGTAAVAGSMVNMASDAAESLDVIDKGSQRMKISAESYQELAHAASLSGVSMSDMERAAKALEGTDLNLDDALAQIYSLETAEERSAAAAELFGERVAYSLTPMLNSSADEMDAMRKEARDLGLVMSGSTVKAGAQLNDTLGNLKDSFGGIVTRLASSLLPIVEKVAETLIDWIPTIQSMFDQLAPVITGLLEQVLPPLMDMAEQIFPIFVDLFNQLLPIFSDLTAQLLPVFTELVQMLLPPIVQITEKLLPPLLQLLSPILSLLSPILQLLQPILDIVVAVIDPLVEIINTLLTPLIELITKLFGDALGPLNTVLSNVANTLINRFKNAFQDVMDFIAPVKVVFENLIDFIKNVFTGNWSAAWDNVKNIFANIWQAIKEAFKMPINWIIDGINSFIDGINSVEIPDWVPVVGGLGFHIGHIPRLAAGGILEKGQVGLLEGTGAEAVVPLENNQRWIHEVAKDMDTAGISSSDTKLDALIALVQQILDTGITLDGDKLVGGLAKRMDKALGRIDAQKARA